MLQRREDHSEETEKPLRDQIIELFKTSDKCFRVKLYRILRKKQDVDDCLQEAYLQAVRGLDTYDDRGELEAWLMRIVVNTGLMKLRTRKQFNGRMIIFDAQDLTRLVENDVGSVDSADGLQNERPAIRPAESSYLFERHVDPEICLQQKETRLIVERAIETLPDREKHAIMSFYFADQNLKEISEKTGVPMGTISVQLTNGRRALRKILQDENL